MYNFIIVYCFPVAESIQVDNVEKTNNDEYDIKIEIYKWFQDDRWSKTRNIEYQKQSSIQGVSYDFLDESKLPFSFKSVKGLVTTKLFPFFLLDNYYKYNKNLINIIKV